MHLQCFDIWLSPSEEPGAETHGSSFKSYDPQTFILDRVSKDKSRAILKVAEHCRAGSSNVFRRIHEKMLVGLPLFFTQMLTVVNDTGIPDLQIHDDAHEISFDWRGMVTQILGEEHVYDTAVAKHLRSLNTEEELSLEALLDHRIAARRSRLKRECRARFRTHIFAHYTHDESRSIESMHLERHHVQHVWAPGSKMDQPPYGHKILRAQKRQVSQAPPVPGVIPRSVRSGSDRDYSMMKPSKVNLFDGQPVHEILKRKHQPSILQDASNQYSFDERGGSKRRSQSPQKPYQMQGSRNGDDKPRLDVPRRKKGPCEMMKSAFHDDFNYWLENPDEALHNSDETNTKSDAKTSSRHEMSSEPYAVQPGEYEVQPGEYEVTEVVHSTECDSGPAKKKERRSLRITALLNQQAAKDRSTVNDS